jgi:hypothetical protein
MSQYSVSDESRSDIVAVNLFIAYLVIIDNSFDVCFHEERCTNSHQNGGNYAA